MCVSHHYTHIHTYIHTYIHNTYIYMHTHMLEYKHTYIYIYGMYSYEDMLPRQRGHNGVLYIRWKTPRASAGRGPHFREEIRIVATVLCMCWGVASLKRTVPCIYFGERLPVFPPPQVLLPPQSRAFRSPEVVLRVFLGAKSALSTEWCLEFTPAQFVCFMQV